MPQSQDTNSKRYIQIGLKIAYYRKLNEMTQEQLAERIGISPGHLSRIETTTYIQPVSLKTLFAIADEFGIPNAPPSCDLQRYSVPFFSS